MARAGVCVGLRQVLDMPNWYLAFAEWRLNNRATIARHGAKFFRQTDDHLLIWMTVMRGHYVGKPPTCNECIRVAQCSKETARRILVSAQSYGYFEVRPGVGDARKKYVHPSAGLIAEYEGWVSRILKISDIIDEGA